MMVDEETLFTPADDRCTADEACDDISNEIITVNLGERERKHEWQKHADEHFQAVHGNPPHPGNMSQMVKHYVELCRRYNIDKETDLESILASTQEEDAVSRQEVHELEDRIDELEEENQRLREKLKAEQLDPSDTLNTAQVSAVILEVLRDGWTSFSELMDELEERDIDSWRAVEELTTRMEVVDTESGETTEVDAPEMALDDLVDKLIYDMVDAELVEVRSDDGGTSYRAAE